MPQDVFNSYLGTYNALIYVVGLYNIQKNTTMTLLMLTLSPYYGPEVRVNFAFYRNFQFFAKPLPVVTSKVKLQNPGPYLVIL